MRPRIYDIRREDMARMKAAGMTSQAIADAFGCSDSHIRHLGMKWGLSQKPRPRPDIDAAIRAWDAKYGKNTHH